MVRTSLSQVRWLSLREIAELWAKTAEIPESTILRELQYAVINIPRLREGLELFDMPPPDEELPDPDEKVDRDWLIEFCTKQEDWPKPEFWIGKQPVGRSFPGRPSVMNAIIDELKDRATQEKLEATLAEQARQLSDWARREFPRRQTPTARTVENGIRDDYRHLRGGLSG